LKKLQERTEEEIIHSILNGNHDDFRILYERYKDKIYNLARTMLGKSELAEEAVQDTFVKAYISLESFRMQSTFFTWIYRIAINRCRDIIKKNRRNGHAIPIDDYKTSDSLIEYSTEGSSEDIRFLILQLKPRFREVIIMRFIDEMSYSDMKKITKIPEGLLRVRVSRAIKQLKKIISNGDKNVR